MSTDIHTNDWCREREGMALKPQQNLYDLSTMSYLFAASQKSPPNEHVRSLGKPRGVTSQGTETPVEHRRVRYILPSSARTVNDT